MSRTREPPGRAPGESGIHLRPRRLALTRSRLFTLPVPIVATVLALALPTSVTALTGTSFLDDGIRATLAECAALAAHAAEFDVSSYKEPSTISAVDYGSDLDAVRPRTSVSPDPLDDSATQGPCAWALTLVVGACGWPHAHHTRSHTWSG